MEKERISTSEYPNEEYDKWSDMGSEEHEAIQNSHKTLEAHSVKRSKDAKEIAEKLASDGFKEEAIAWHSLPSVGGYEDNAYTVYCVKGDLALKYDVFSNSEEYKDLNEALSEKKKELEKSQHYRFIDSPNLHSVDIFNDEELREAEKNALSIEGQCEKIYEEAPIAGEYKIVDFTDFSNKESAKCAENIIRKEKVVDAENKEDVKLIFLKPEGGSNSEGVPYMSIEVVQPDLDPGQYSVGQSSLPYGTDERIVKHTGYGTGGIQGVPITEKEALINGLKENYKKESSVV